MESRQLQVPRRALVQAGVWDGLAAHADREDEDMLEENAEPDELQEDSLVPIGHQPVLSGIQCDWPGRSKVTKWAGHSATFNGGWCMCNQKGRSAEVWRSSDYILQ